MLLNILDRKELINLIKIIKPGYIPITAKSAGNNMLKSISKDVDEEIKAYFDLVNILLITIIIDECIIIRLQSIISVLASPPNKPIDFKQSIDATCFTNSTYHIFNIFIDRFML